MEGSLSILGSIASIAAALWAFWEARKSVRAASQSEALRDELVHRRKMLEVSQVYSETKRILSVVLKVGPSSAAKSLRGVDCAEIAREVEVYSSFIFEQSENFGDSFQEKARNLCADLKDDIEALAEAKTASEKKDFGKRIYYKIKDFVPFAKGLSDEKRERMPKQ